MNNVIPLSHSKFHNIPPNKKYGIIMMIMIQNGTIIKPLIRIFLLERHNDLE